MKGSTSQVEHDECERCSSQQLCIGYDFYTRGFSFIAFWLWLHAFIHIIQYVEKMEYKTRILSPALIVSTSSWEKTLVDKQGEPSLLYVQRKSIVWDFPMFNLLGIDVILGMDSLSQNHSIIDC